MIDSKKEIVLPKAESDKALANRFQTFFKEKIEKIRASFIEQSKSQLYVGHRDTIPNMEKLLHFEPTNADGVEKIFKSHGLKC